MRFSIELFCGFLLECLGWFLSFSLLDVHFNVCR